MGYVTDYSPHMIYKPICFNQTMNPSSLQQTTITKFTAAQPSQFTEGPHNMLCRWKLEILSTAAHHHRHCI